MPFDPLSGDIVNIRHEVFQIPFGPEKDKLHRLFKLRYKEWSRGSFIEQRLSIQKLIKLILDTGWNKPYYPHDKLVDDLKRISSTNLNKIQTNNGKMLLYGNYSKPGQPGRLLLECLTDWPEVMSNAWCNKRMLYKSIVHLLRYKHDVTMHSLLTQINHMPDYRYRAGNRFICPNVYRYIIKKFNLGGMLLADPYPYFGSKAIAATIENCNYHCSKEMVELSDFLGTKWYPLDRNHYDCVLLDYDFIGDNINCGDLEHWKKLADIIIMYVPHSKKNLMEKPTRWIPIETDFRRGSEPDYIYYYC